MNQNNYDEQPPQLIINNETIINPMDLNFQSFLPKEDDCAVIITNDIPIIDNILNQNESFKAIISNRIQGLKLIDAKWANGKRKEAIQSTEVCKDLGMVNDLIAFFLIKSEMQYLNLKIELALDLFPSIIKLASSKYDAYIQNAVNASWVLLKVFSEAIVNRKNSPSNAKKDLKADSDVKDELYNSFIRFCQQLRLVPNVDSLITGVKKIEGLSMERYANDIESLIKKCT